MTLVVNHAFVSGIPDIPADAGVGKVVPQAHWNSAHSLSGQVDPGQGGTGQASYAKGDLLVSPGGAVLNKLPVGGNGAVLVADSSQTNGVKWGGVVINSWVPFDTSYTNNATLTDLFYLSIHLTASHTYILRSVLFFTCAAAGGIKAAIASTALPTNLILNGYIVDSGSNGTKGNTQASAFGTTLAASNTTGTNGLIVIEGTAEISTTGDINIQAAQNTVNATPTIVKRGSYITAIDVT